MIPDMSSKYKKNYWGDFYNRNYVKRMTVQFPTSDSFNE